MNLRQERLLSRRSQLGRERFKCWNAWCSWHRQRHERGRYRCVALSLFTDPAVHHVRVQAMRQGHTTDAGPRLGTQGKYLCLELLAVFTPAWAVLIQRLFHRLHDPPSWGRCPLHAGSSRWDRRALTLRLHPGKPVVITTGFISDDLRKNAPTIGVSELIPKPNTGAQLLKSIERLALQLAQSRGPGSSSQTKRVPDSPGRAPCSAHRVAKFETTVGGVPKDQCGGRHRER